VYGVERTANNPIDNYERFRVRPESRNTPEPYGKGSVRVAPGTGDVEPSYFPLQQLPGIIYRTPVEIGLFDAGYRTGNLFLLLSTIADDDHFSQCGYVGLQRDVYRRLRAYSYFGRNVSHEGEHERGVAAYGDRVRSVSVRHRPVLRPLLQYVYTRKPAAVIGGGYPARNGSLRIRLTRKQQE